jgi:hypothetical protein
METRVGWRGFLYSTYRETGREGENEIKFSTCRVMGGEK